MMGALEELKSSGNPWRAGNTGPKVSCEWSVFYFASIEDLDVDTKNGE